MNARIEKAHPEGVVKRLLIVALLLTLSALLAALQFEFRTTGGTLFVFATFGPVLIIVPIVIVAGVIFFEFRRQHRLFEVERYEPGQVIFQQGDPGDCAYFVRSGEVEVLRESNGVQSVIAKLANGAYFGEMALLSNEPRNATVRAVSDTEVAVLGKRNFLLMLSVLPATQEDVLNTVRKRAMARKV